MRELQKKGKVKTESFHFVMALKNRFQLVTANSCRMKPHPLPALRRTSHVSLDTPSRDVCTRPSSASSRFVHPPPQPVTDGPGAVVLPPSLRYLWLRLSGHFKFTRHHKSATPTFGGVRPRGVCAVSRSDGELTYRVEEKGCRRRFSRVEVGGDEIYSGLLRSSPLHPGPPPVCPEVWRVAAVATSFASHPYVDLEVEVFSDC